MDLSSWMPIGDLPCYTEWMVNFRRFGSWTVAVLAFAASACGGEQSDPATPASTTTSEADVITVNLKNWKVESSAASISAGAYTFVATHNEDDAGHAHGEDEAGATHQLVVAPLNDGAEIGTSSFGAPVLNLPDIKLGEQKSGEVTLEPGRYELSCLVVEEVDGESVNHYEEGMFALLIVE